MNRVLRYVIQVFYYAFFMVVVWFFSIKPPYQQLKENEAVITLSFVHATKLREACRKVSQEELLKLAPNMRLSIDCPRARSPLVYELYLDEQLLHKSILDPPGFHNDQSVNIFSRVKALAGDHVLRVWMNDDINVEGATYELKQSIALKPEQQILIDFNAASGGFFIN